jgi:ankyrin repeat protein
MSEERIDELVYKAIDAIERGKPARAIMMLRKAAELAPARREIWSRLASLHMQAKQWKETGETAARAIALDPFDTTARAAAALAAVELGDGESAWYHWAAIELAGDRAMAAGVSVSIESALDPDFTRDAGAGQERARQRVRADFPGEGAKRALLAAALRGDADALRAALAAGADPNATDGEDRTALLIAAADGALELCRLLLDAGADPNRFRIETMFVAVLDTPLGRARHGKHKALIKLLKQRGAKETDELPDPHALYVERNGTPHQRLVQALWGDDPERVRRALADGADPNGNAHDASERVLAAAVRLRKPEYVRMLLAAGADPNTRSNGRPVLFEWLTDAVAVDCAIALLEGGADPNLKAKKRTVLSYLPEPGKQRRRYTRALVEHGLDRALRDEDGRTLQAIATDDGDHALVKLLR